MTDIIDIAPMSAEAFEVRQGQTVRIIDIAGGQPGDLVAFNAHDHAERFSQARTRVENGVCRVTTDHTLWTNAVRPRVMFTITADSGGRHDLLFSPCCRYALEKRFGVSRDGCREHLVAALASAGIGELDIPDPLSLFFNVDIGPDGRIAPARHTSQPGSAIDLRAEMDCLVAVSTCSAPIAGRTNSPYRVEIT